MKELKILVAPWGDPIAWKKVKYRLGDDEREGWDTVALPADNLGVEDVVFVVSDTLLNSVIGIANKDKWFMDRVNERFEPEEIREFQTWCTEAWSQVSQSIEEGEENRQIYQLVKNLVRDYAQRFVDRYVRQQVQQLQPRITIFVEPGTGRFDYLEAMGNPVDFYYVFLADLVKYLISKNVLDHDRLTIYLDTTHGINYFTIMTYKAIRVIASLLANLIDVNVVTYNTDPFIPQAYLSKALFVHKTEDILAEPYTSIYYKGEPPNRKVKEVLYFLVSAKFYMPILMLRFFPDFDVDKQIELEIERTGNNINFNIEYIAENKPILEMQRVKNLSKEIELYVKAWLWEEMLADLFERAFGSDGKELIESRRQRIKMAELRKVLLDNSRVKHPLLYIAKKEFDTIFNENKFITYTSKYEHFKRNIVAHSGFWIRREMDELVVKREHFDKVKEVLLELAKTQ